MTDIRLPADILFSLGPIGVTNGHLAAFSITVAFSLVGLLSYKRLRLVPGRLQSSIELLVEFMLDRVESAFGDKKTARKFFPLLMTSLLFILIANQFSLIPLVGNIVTGETPVLRSPTSDLAMTLALSLFVVVLANVLAFSISPLHHIGNFIKVAPLFRARSLGELARAVLDFLLGLLDIISEFAKIISLGGRLFGNIFAGEVMVAVIAGLSIYTQFLAPIPFIFLSLFSGVIQAFVFVLLATQFIAGSIGSAKEAKVARSV
jgi:F-type H+-transporting ATPase subunit a